MKSVQIFALLLFWIVNTSINGQDIVVEMPKDTMMDAKKCCDMVMMKPKHWITAEYRYYLNPAGGTITELSGQGFVLDEEASEIGVKFGQFPKIFYYQQLGTLTNGNYSAIHGLGLKEKYQIDVIKNPAVVLAPYIELGAGFYQLSLSKGVTNNSIVSAINGQVTENRLNNFSITGDLGLNLGYAFKMLGAEITITANGGYMTNLPSNWKTGHSLAFKEKLDLSSLYFGGRVSVALIECCGM